MIKYVLTGLSFYIKKFDMAYRVFIWCIKMTSSFFKKKKFKISKLLNS